MPTPIASFLRARLARAGLDVSHVPDHDLERAFLRSDLWGTTLARTTSPSLVAQADLAWAAAVAAARTEPIDVAVTEESASSECGRRETALSPSSR